MPVKTGTETLLVEVVRNEANGATQDEETIEDTHLSSVSLDCLFFIQKGKNTLR